jgi:hypothetical protein
VTDHFAEGSSRIYRKITTDLHHQLLGTEPPHSDKLSADCQAIIRKVKKRMNRLDALGFVRAITKPGTKIWLNDNDLIFLQENRVKITIMKKHLRP